MRFALISFAALASSACGTSSQSDGGEQARAEAAAGGSAGASSAGAGANANAGSATADGGGGVAMSGGGAAASTGSSAGESGSVAGGGQAGTGGSAGAGNPEGVPPEYQLFIDETFAEPASLGQLKFAVPADWRHEAEHGGYLEATAATYAPPYASLHSLAIFGSQSFGAFVLDVEVMQTNPSGGHRDFCIAWGLESPSRYYYAHIAEAHDAVAHNLHIVLDADRTAITTSHTAGFAWGTDAWHQLRVTRTPAGEMSVFADGAAMPILAATDARLGAGYVGFGSFDDKGRVRNVKLWAPSAETRPAAFFVAK